MICVDPKSKEYLAEIQNYETHYKNSLEEKPKETEETSDKSGTLEDKPKETEAEDNSGTLQEKPKETEAEDNSGKLKEGQIITESHYDYPPQIGDYPRGYSINQIMHYEKLCRGEFDQLVGVLCT